ncbi:hypothetical protein BH18ACT5_BH18ACT5_07610 [soil metagenome]
MNRSARSKPARRDDRADGGIEVLELDAPVTAAPPSDQGARRGGRWLALFGLAVAITLGLSVLPDPAPLPIAAEDTLPTPGVATTIPSRETVVVGIVGDDTFPIQFESSLAGFRSLAGPAHINGAWWMIGNAAQSLILASGDGIEWESNGNFPVEDGRFVEISDLIVTDGALVAAGQEGTLSESGGLVESLRVWRSADGDTWIPEQVAKGSAFFKTRVVANGHNLVVTTTDESAEDHLFHSSWFTQWEEIPITFSTGNGIVMAPEGGFLLSTGQGAALTSAYGGHWSRNQAIERGFYSQWEDRVVGTYTRSGRPTMSVLGADERLVVRLPDEFEGCRIEGGLTGLLAICANQSPWGYDLYLSKDGLVWAKSELALLTDSFKYEGFTDQGFLVSIAGRSGELVVARVNLP